MSSSSTSRRLPARRRRRRSGGGPSGRRRRPARPSRSATRRRRRPATRDLGRPRPGCRRRARRSRAGVGGGRARRRGRRRSEGQALARRPPAGRWPASGSVVRPSRSLDGPTRPPAAPVTNALAPDGIVPSCFGPALVVDAGFARAKRALAGAVSVPSGLTVQPRGPRGRRRRRRSAPSRTAVPQDGQRTPGALHQVQDGLLVPPGLGRDQRIVGVVLDRHLEGVGEDPVDAVLVVARRPGADVQVARLLGLVAVRRGHVLADRRQRGVVLRRHVAGTLVIV